MQVKCDQCGTEYAVEESRIPEAGLKGKCTHCGHVFPLRRTLQLDFDAVSKKLEKAAKSTKWRIRKAGGEELEFSDLGTLRRWIVEKKVHREDEISKTGDDWKPLDTIVELSKMFTSPEHLGPVSAAALKAKQQGDEAQAVTNPAAPSPLSDAPASLDVSPSDVLAAESQPPRPAAPTPPPPAPEKPPRREERGHPLTGLNLPTSPKQLTVRDDLLSARLPSPPPPSSVAARALLERDPRSPAAPARVNISRQDATATESLDLSASTVDQTEPAQRAGSGDDPFSLRISDSLPGLQPASLQSIMSSRPDGIPGLPLPAAPTNFSFQGEAPPTQVNTGGRGFLSGVVTAIAMVGVAYFVYDRFVEPGIGDSAVSVERALGADEAIGLLDRGAAAYGRDTEEGRRVADQAYTRLLNLLPPSDQRGALARRAHLGRARVALTRAEYAQLDDLVATPYLQRAAAAVGAADGGGRADGPLLLARADLHRLNGAVGPARAALEQAEVAGAPGAEVAYVRATLDSARDPAATLTALEAASPATKALPRFAYYRAVTLQRAGRRPAARAALEQILSAYPGHVGARRRLASLVDATSPTATPKPTEADAAQTPGVAGTVPALPPSTPAGSAVETASSATSAGADDKADIAQATQAKGVGTPATASAPQPGAAGPKTVAAAKPAARVNASASKSKAPGKTVGTSSAVKSKKPKKSVPGGGSRTKKRAHTGGFDGLMSAANRLLENGRAREARAKFLAASRKRPSSPEPLANLGWCELELRRTGKAISFFKKALGRNPRYADALYGLGVAHERNQDPARAKKAYQTYLAVNPRGSKIRMVKRRLDRLR